MNDITNTLPEDTLSDTFNRILVYSESLFTQFGFTRVTMSEIAAGLSISKKTLYKHFKNKEEIIHAILSRTKRAIEMHVDLLLENQHLPFLKKLHLLLEFLGKSSSRMKGPLIEELKQHFPSVYLEIKEFQRDRGLNKFTELIKEGVEKGVFRNDINTEIIVYIYISAVKELIDPSFLSTSSLSADQVYAHITSILFEGILTENSRKEFIAISHLNEEEQF
ncbi:MAG: TetR/AcrR family transcriptional regulator [Ignavibacteriaceae bacterium]|nr:TetR/AcrR family transcriptional regulator [Ignavibacteriaceae bacterium]